MYPWFRLIKIMLRRRSAGPMGPLDTSVVKFRVWPTDLDSNGHLNNGRYLTIMDLGRYDLVNRSGLMRILFERKWYPVVHSAMIRFRRALDPWQVYELHTNIVGWDDKGFFIEQRFIREGKVVAVGTMKGVFLAKEGRVAPTLIAESLGADPVSPAVPEAILAWQRALADPQLAERPPA